MRYEETDLKGGRITLGSLKTTGKKNNNKKNSCLKGTSGDIMQRTKTHALLIIAHGVHKEKEDRERDGNRKRQE